MNYKIWEEIIELAKKKLGWIDSMSLTENRRDDHYWEFEIQKTEGILDDPTIITVKGGGATITEAIADIIKQLKEKQYPVG